MEYNTHTISVSAATSALSWWHEAGVDTFVAEVPRDWLAVVPSESKTMATTKVATPSPKANVRLPETLDAFLAWFATSADVPGVGASAQRIAPAGNPQATLMVLIDMPEPEDMAAGQLLSGSARDMFEKMLTALKLNRENIWFAAMVPARVTGATLSAEESARIAEIARYHVSLIRPRKLWLLGRAASRALLGMDETEARGRLHFINHDDAKTDVIASVHPRVLLQTPKRKAEVWADMQRLFEE
jgi:DNA polymerase